MDENEEQETPELDEGDILRDKYPQSKRKTMDKSSFCGPDMTFPVTDAEDVIHASQRLHNASGDQASIKACVIGKAKANGWPLPDTWTATTKNDGDRAMTTETDTSMYVPITRIDTEKWEVEGPATSDITDRYQTFFDFDSSKRAFNAWPGNVREMHDNKKAVGRAIKIEEDNDNNLITVRARVSKGAPDTWQKVLDGTLTGFSIGIPAGSYKKKMVERNGQSIPMYYDFELAEVSLVDNPGNPDCKITIVRADGVATDVLDDSADEPVPQAGDLNRAGARISHATQSDLHSLRDGHMHGASKVMQLCGCDECGAAMNALDPDGDGDIDILSSLDIDQDGGKQAMQGVMNYNLEAAITRNLSPVVQRMNAVLSTFAQQPTAIPQIIPEFSTEPLERRIADVERAFDAKLTEVRSVLTEVKELATKIAAMPMPGGPVMTSVDKRLATSPQQGYNRQDDIAALQRAAQLTNNNDLQVALAAELIKRQDRG
jgi:hypothetical protein